MHLSKAYVAVVEDDPGLREDLTDFLGLRGFDATGFSCAEDLFLVWLDSAFDLVILDIGLPGVDGLEAAHWLRAHGTAGIVMLTALGSQSDRVTGLEAGADAYLVKSASLELIEATCHSVLRRILPQQAASADRPAPGWRLSPKRWRLVAPGGQAVTLTHNETLFLQCLLEHPGLPASRETLLAAQGKQDTIANLRNLDNCASRLRRKVFKEIGLKVPIRPSYGTGYTFVGEGGIDLS